MRCSEDQIIQIFCSGGNDFRVDKQSIVNIKYLLDNELLNVAGSFICDKNDYLRQIDIIKNNRSKFLEFEGGSIGHMALKVIGKNHLIDRGLSK